MTDVGRPKMAGSGPAARYFRLFMYRRRACITHFHIAADFQIVLYKVLYVRGGGGTPPPHCFPAAVLLFVWVWRRRGVEWDIVNTLCPANHPPLPGTK
jgi:hypothetical protein